MERAGHEPRPRSARLTMRGARDLVCISWAQQSGDVSNGQQVRRIIE
jgi:hypothetical protein